MIHIPRVLIIGDAMLDTYVYGSVSRVSPEAPIPVVCPYQTEDRPGGAANVACNAASLGARVTALFVLGVDEQAARLKDKLDSYGVDTQWICKGKDLHTVNKIRLTGNGQQITRIDLYDRYALDAELENVKSCCRSRIWSSSATMERESVRQPYAKKSLPWPGMRGKG